MEAGDLTVVSHEAERRDLGRYFSEKTNVIRARGERGWRITTELLDGIAEGGQKLEIELKEKNAILMPDAGLWGYAINTVSLSGQKLLGAKDRAYLIDLPEDEGAEGMREIFQDAAALQNGFLLLS